MTDEVVSPRTGAQRTRAARNHGLIVLVTLPLLALAAIVVWRQTEAEKQRVRDDRVALARHVALSAAALVDGHLSSIATLALAPVLAQADAGGDVRALLDAAQVANPDWSAAGVIDPGGRPLSDPRPESRGVSLADRDYFQALQASRRPGVSGAVVGKVSGAPAIVLIAPVEFGREKPGALAVTLSLTRLEAQLRALVAEPAVRVTVVDGSGQAFIHPDRGTALALTRLSGQPEVQAALGGPAGSRVLRHEGREQLVAYAPVPSTGWAVLLEQSTDQAFGATRRAQNTQLTLLAMAALTSTALALYLGSRLTRLYESERTARQQTEDALHARDEFLSSASHDLKSPLATIKTSVQLLRRRLGRGESISGVGLIEVLDRIDGVATRMATQTDELVNVARLPLEGALTITTARTDLVALARRVAVEQQQTTARHEITVEAVAPSLDGVWDEARLDRAIGNLVTNAIKYSPDGGPVTITARRERDDDGDWAVLAIQDEGLGIPALDLPRVFDRFHRGANVIERVSGSGIGLASARQIVEQHGGTIAVESVEGKGSIFTVRLPLPEGEPPSAPDRA